MADRCPITGACPAPPACPNEPLVGGSGASRPIRWTLASAGVGCVALGAIGVVVPGLPTTVFLILASWCFARSCPWLERKLIRNRLFRPFVWALDSQAPMPLRARVICTIVMWTAIALSCALILSRASGPIAGPAILAALIVASGAAGTWCIWRIAGRARGGAARKVLAPSEADRVAAAA